MSCCKCNGQEWIEIEGSKYCHHHGEVRLAEIRRIQESRGKFVRKSPRDGQVVIKMVHQGSWITVEGVVNQMEMNRPAVPVQSISGKATVMVAPGRDTLTLEIVPTSIKRHTEEPDV